MASVTTVGINALRDMQDDGAKRAEAAVVATEAAGMGTKTYRFIADSVINRNLDTAEWAAEWATIKSEITMDTKNIGNMADTDKETRLAEKGKAALLAIVALFENEMMPLLRATDEGIPPRMRETDDRIYRQVDIVVRVYDQFAQSLSHESRLADEVFDKRGVLILWIGVLSAAVATVIALIAGVLIGRGINRGLERAGDFVQTVADGHLTRTLAYPNKDEIGALIGHLNGMVDRLRQVVGEVNSAAENVSVGSQQLAAGAETLS